MQVWHAIGPDGLPEQLPLDSLDQNLPPPIGEVQQIAYELFVRLQSAADWNEPV